MSPGLSRSGQSVISFVAVLVGLLAMGSDTRTAEGVMITYISSTRYIEGIGIPREEAVGFTDFDVSRGAFVGFPMSTITYARVEASQTSRLLSDRIEVSTATLTQFIENPLGNSISAISLFDIQFTIDQPTQVSLAIGPIFSRSNGGSAGVSLLNSAGVTVLSATGSPLDLPLQTAILQPGRYSLFGGCESGSRQSLAGAAQAIAVLTVPASSMGVGVAAALGLAGLRRRNEA